MANLSCGHIHGRHGQQMWKEMRLINMFPESDSISIQSTFNEHSINNTHGKSMKIPQLWTFPARKIHPIMATSAPDVVGGATWAVRIRTHRARNVPASSGWEAAEHAEHAELCPVKVSLRNNDLLLSIQSGVIYIYIYHVYHFCRMLLLNDG